MSGSFSPGESIKIRFPISYFETIFVQEEAPELVLKGFFSFVRIYDIIFKRVLFPFPISPITKNIGLGEFDF